MTERLVWIGSVCDIVTANAPADADDPSTVCDEGEYEPCVLCEHDDCVATVTLSGRDITPGYE